MADRLTEVINFYHCFSSNIHNQVFTTCNILVQSVLYAIEFSNYNGINTALVHYPFSLSIFLC